MQATQLDQEIEKKTKKDYTQTKYVINIIAVESLAEFPDFIDCMSILYKNSNVKTQCPPMKGFLPKNPSTEVTDDQIDQLYENFKLINMSKR